MVRISFIIRVRVRVKDRVRVRDKVRVSDRVRVRVRVWVHVTGRFRSRARAATAAVRRKCVIEDSVFHSCHSSMLSWSAFMMRK